MKIRVESLFLTVVMFCSPIYGGNLELRTEKDLPKPSPVHYAREVADGPDSDIPKGKYRSGSIYILFEKKLAPPAVGVLLRLCNSTNHSIYFSGYGVNGPWYRIQRFVEPSWEEHQVGWFCGTGLTENEIPPGKSATFDVSEWRVSGLYRVGVNYSHSVDKKEYETVWSDTISSSQQTGAVDAATSGPRH